MTAEARPEETRPDEAPQDRPVARVERASIGTSTAALLSPRTTFVQRAKALMRTPPRMLWRQAVYAVVAPLRVSSAFSISLLPRPRALKLVPPDPWPGNGERGALLLRGEFAFGGLAVPMPDGAWFADIGHSDPEWQAELFAFGWLGDLQAVGKDAARHRARALVDEWMRASRRWNPIAWRADVTGLRLSHWLAQHDFYCASASDDFRARFFASVQRQARYLARMYPWPTEGLGAVAALKGLIYAEVCVTGSEKRLGTAIAWLEDLLGRQVMPDGGHVERSPSSHLAVLRHLVDIRSTLLAAGYETPKPLQTAIDRMAPMLRFFRHGDGGLVLFNDSTEEEPWYIDLVLQRAEARGKPFASAPHSGFQRMDAGRARILVDTGAPPPAPFNAKSHAGTLSFEFSVGRERLIVNCGAAPASHAWRRAMRATAAHSTLTIGEKNSSEVLGDAGIGRRARVLRAARTDSDDGLWLDLAHDGYVKPFGIVHGRRLWLSAVGDNLRGEDRLEGGRGQGFAIRFHLHPRVRASRAEDGSHVLLRLPSGAGWRFRAHGAQIGLEQGIYIDDRSLVQRTEQIVLKSEASLAAVTVKWALQRIDTVR